LFLPDSSRRPCRPAVSNSDPWTSRTALAEVPVDKDRMPDSLIYGCLVAFRNRNWVLLQDWRCSRTWFQDVLSRFKIEHKGLNSAVRRASDLKYLLWLNLLRSYPEHPKPLKQIIKKYNLVHTCNNTTKTDLSLHTSW
jgi:hypothetical protein